MVAYSDAQLAVMMVGSTVLQMDAKMDVSAVVSWVLS
jgi:hypothetical protein